MEICHVAEGPLFARSTDCIIRASGCKQERDVKSFQLPVCTVFWQDVNARWSALTVQWRPTFDHDPFTRSAVLHCLAVVTVIIATVETGHTLAHCVFLGCTVIYFLLVVI